MPEDTPVYVFQDDHGKWLATVDESEAREYVQPLARPRYETMTLGDLARRDPHAFVRARAQYYWAADLLTGAARGAVI